MIAPCVSSAVLIGFHEERFLRHWWSLYYASESDLEKVNVCVEMCIECVEV